MTIRAKKTGVYVGKVCAKHPLLEGKRYAAGRQCIGCSADKRKKMYASNPSRFRKYTRDYSKAVADKIIEEYGGACALCFTRDRDLLTIDHVNCDGAEERRARSLNGKKRTGSHVSMRNAIVKAGFPKDRYRLLCFNCQWKAYLYYRKEGKPLMPAVGMAQVDWSNTRAAQRAITAWANRSFPKRTAHGALVKLVLEEIPELLQDLDSPGEYADTLILLYDLATLKGIDIPTALRDKMMINDSRHWLFDETTGLAKHVIAKHNLGEH